MRAPVSAKLGDKVFVAIGSTIYQQSRDGPYNFINAIHDHALHFLGDAFLESEEAKSFAQRHPAIQWMHAYVEHSERLDREGVSEPRARQVGYGAAWFRFAYDLYTIRDNSKLETRLRARLMLPRDFQGARHELRVAGLCVAAGFELQFEDETDNERTHPEFVATDRFSSARIAVEARSRHRYGAHGFQGGTVIQPGENVSIRGPVLEAYKKQTALPLYVFVDVNLPPISAAGDWDRWIAEIDKTMSDLQLEGYADPCPANIVFFSNDPSHYLADAPIGNDADRLWIKYYLASCPRVQHPPSDMARRFMEAYRHGGLRQPNFQIGAACAARTQR